MSTHSVNSANVATYFEGSWHEGSPLIASPMTHSFWVSSIVFDGARAFEGVAPDLDLHCERVVHSAEALGLRAVLRANEIHDLCKEGVSRFPRGSELYIRPMFYAEDGWVDPNPDTTRFVLCVYTAALPRGGFSTCLSTKRRPLPDTAPTNAKASCLYPNVGLATREARAKGFDNPVLLDPLGNVAEFATANLFFVKNGVVHTPVANGTFLAGITRMRVIALLRHAGVEVHERAIDWSEVLEADEIFSTGNYAKLQPVTRIDAREIAPGPFYARAKALYWEFAHG